MLSIYLLLIQGSLLKSSAGDHMWPDIEHRSTTCKKSTISPASLVIFIKQNREDNNNSNNNHNDIVLIISALYYFGSFFKYLV